MSSQKEETVAPLYTFNVIMLGDTSVGKTSLLKSLTEGATGREEHMEPTIGVGYYSYNVDIESGVSIRLNIWDTAGQERFRSIGSSYYHHAMGVVIVYDVTRKNTFVNIAEWLSQANVQVTEQQAVYMILGNKADLNNRQVTQEEGIAGAPGPHIFMETSALSGHNLELAFKSLGVTMYNKLKMGEVQLREGWRGISRYVPDTNPFIDEPKKSSNCC